jgi:predicted RNA-binding Zn-ribbon protein involved in translation (DUF1610 family)
MNGARLLKRVFEFDLEHCPNCGDKLQRAELARRRQHQSQPWE